MVWLAAGRGGLDRWAIALSWLCMVHCLSGAVILTLAASAGGMLLDPLVHEIGLGLAILLGAIAIGRGVIEHGYIMPAAIASLGLGTMAGALTLEHGNTETLYTIIGVAILALGHDLNRRALV